MTLHRRSFLSGCAATACTLPMIHPAFAALSLGDAQLTTVSDGSLVLPGAFIFGPMPQADLPPLLDEFQLSHERLTPECNLALYRDGQNMVLFDVGSGPDFMPSAGRLQDSLAAIGLSPDDVTHIVFTHAHPDHIWGLLDDFDDLVFPEASYFIGQAEWDYWWNPETVNTIGEARASFAVGAKRRFQAIEDRVIRFEADTEILPGIAAIASYGHTPGHMSFELRNGSDSALILGDAIGNHHVAFRKPAWPSGADQDAALAAKSRQRLLDRAADEQFSIVGFHLPGGGIGRVERRSDGFQFVEHAG